jgi:hypothetical protein
VSSSGAGGAGGAGGGGSGPESEGVEVRSSEAEA